MTSGDSRRGAETNARDPRQGTPLAKAHSHTPVTATLGVWGVVPTTRRTYTLQTYRGISLVESAHRENGNLIRHRDRNKS